MTSTNPVTVILDVRGKKIKTLKTTLMKSEWFQKYFENWNNNDDIFIDVDSKLFNHFLNKLSDENYVLPDDPNVINLFKYYNCFLVVTDNEKYKDKEIELKQTNKDIRIQSFHNQRFNGTVCDIRSLELVITVYMDGLDMSDEIIEIRNKKKSNIKFLSCNCYQIWLFFDLVYRTDRFCCFRLREKYCLELIEWSGRDAIIIDINRPHCRFSYVCYFNK